MVPRWRHHRCARAHTEREGGGGGGGSCGCAFASWLFHCARPHGALLPDGPYMAAERASVWRSVCVRERRGRRRSRRKEEEEEELKLPTRFFSLPREFFELLTGFFFFFFFFFNGKRTSSRITVVVTHPNGLDSFLWSLPCIFYLNKHFLLLELSASQMWLYRPESLIKPLFLFK